MKMYRFLSLLTLLTPGIVAEDPSYEPMIGGPSGTLGAGLVDPELMDTIVSTGMTAVGTCGIDASMLGLANQMTYAQEDPLAPLHKFAASMKNTCSGAEKDRFVKALDDFESCSAIDLIDYMEFLPSAIVGTLEVCLDMFVSVETAMLEQFNANPTLAHPDTSNLNIEFTQQCFDAYFGNNVFGNANLKAFMRPQKTIDCFMELSKSLPDCTYQVWPIPIVGSILRKVACLIGNAAPIMEKSALLELRKFDTCLPASYTEGNTCDDIRAACMKEGSSFFLSTAIIKSFQGMSLADECVKVAQMNDLQSVLGKYQEFNNRCTGHDWDKLVEGIDNEQSAVPRADNSKRTKETSSAVSAPEPSSSSGGSGGGGGGFSTFLGGLVTGLVVAGVAFMANRQRSSQYRESYDNVQYSSSMELS